MPDVRDHKDTRDDIARVAQALRTRLADGTYLPGRWLPTGPALATELGVTTYAVQIVIKRLIVEKSVKSARSKGFYVPDPADPAAVPPGRAANGTAVAPGKRSTRFGDDAARVERAVRARLADGTYPAGTWVPSKRSLMSEFDVTADAVRTAMRRLAADSLIKSVPGVGMYVPDPAAPGAVPARPESSARIKAEKVLRARIASGDYPAGTQLPAMWRLSAELDVGKEAVHRAVKRLSDEGLVMTAKGRGAVVRGAGSPRQAASAPSTPPP